MALIPLTYKLDWYDPSQPGGVISTLNNNANTATSSGTQYSMQDIIDTVTGGGIIPWPYNYDAGLFNLMQGTAQAPTNSNNTSLGVAALNSITTGEHNTVMGRGAGNAIQGGSFNVFMGVGAGEDVIGGNNNVAVGDRALQNDNAYDTVAIGTQALQNQSIGASSYNVAVGRSAGRFVDTGEQNTIIGGLTGGIETGDNNIVIGYNAAASAVGVDNEITLGNANITTLRIPGLQSGASDGDVLTYSSGSGDITLQAPTGGSTYSSTIDYQTGNPQTTTSRRYWIVVHLENKTVGSPDFGSTYTGPQDWYFKRQNASVGTQGGMPFNLFYNQYTPALDPGYDAGGGCGASPTCLRVMMEESVADINTLNSGGSALGTAFTIMTTDMAALSSYRAPLTMNIDGNGASPGNGTLGIRIIYGGNTSPSSDDDTCLPSTVSVYFRDTTDTSSKVGGPQFNLVWAGADTVFAQTQNGGATYTAGTDFVFSGNPGLSVTRRYELFFQDEVNAYNRCSYLKVTDGRVVFEDLPTVDPVSKGVLWNDAGDLKISLG